MTKTPEENEYYFSITTFKGDARSRTVGSFPELETAQQAIEENWGDIYENGWYDSAEIEKNEWGLYPDSTERWIYKWNVKKEKFVKCEPNESDE